MAEDKGYFPDKWHQPNFVDCIRSRQKPNADIEQAHRSACLVHLANVAYRTGKPALNFDPHSETFLDFPEANDFLKPQYRGVYAVPNSV